MSEGCIFCRIVAGHAPAVRVFDNGQVMAFLDVFPSAEGHLLIVPHRHHADLWEIDDADVAAVAQASRHLAVALRTVTGAEGLRVNQFNGAGAGQTVFHYHVHLIPVRDGQRVGSHGRDRADLAQLEALAERIRAALPAT